MTFITGKHVSRRTVIKGMGASMALPFLDAMVPAGRPIDKVLGEPGDARLVCIEDAMGLAGSNEWGVEQRLFAPATVGKDFKLEPNNCLSPLEDFQDYLTIVSNSDVRAAESYGVTEIGGDHERSSCVFLTQAHPRQVESSDVFLGPSIDQIHAQRYGQGTVLPSLELCTETVDAGGGCGRGYHCAYRDAISWASAKQPLPAIREPRVVFERLFGAGDTPEERADRLQSKRSKLDWIATEIARFKRALGASDRVAMDQYVENIRELERRLTIVEERNSSGGGRELPEAPASVPDSWEEHMRLMFDLQVVAFEADLTRVISFKIGKDLSNRVFPESGVNQSHHAATHHGNQEESIMLLNRINQYRFSVLPYFLDKLLGTVEGDTNLLEKTAVVWGSAMGDANVHAHRRAPLVLVGHANGSLEGNLHLKTRAGMPMANAMLSLLNGIGHEEMDSFGDSTSRFYLSSQGPSITTAQQG
jgi:hypothetical protein